MRRHATIHKPLYTCTDCQYKTHELTQALTHCINFDHLYEVK